MPGQITARRLATLASAAIAVLSLSTPLLASELVMFERPGCGWCARFNAEIAPIYGKTDEGRALPLRRVDLTQKLPADLAGIDPGAFTPTFVVVDQGHEIGRIRGYPGDAFFFGLLGRIMNATSGTPARS
ncbi:putative thioredoxin, SoxS [Bradyrhizobium oligotrophicum S58]|uniref:Putative thioredoxin, SoxS n=1 Tax=Bradyrhizobium oligotrophicum S58 TaxID=1245469 RepID=M4ZAK8_9BRAD|nr:thioredoxin family protein [Bradyrhizobium oligotrophicum]BAM90396.1 putative thioredoxin, SoxS [Bradyrhizobium oligotrophicum S58]